MLRQIGENRPLKYGKQTGIKLDGSETPFGHPFKLCTNSDPEKWLQ